MYTSHYILFCEASVSSCPPEKHAIAGDSIELLVAGGNWILRNAKGVLVAGYLTLLSNISKTHSDVHLTLLLLVFVPDVYTRSC